MSPILSPPSLGRIRRRPSSAARGASRPFLFPVDLGQSAVLEARYKKNLMLKALELLRLAQDCYARARIAVNEYARRRLIRQGDEYLKEADELQRERASV
jgi:hypothetical protein